MAASESVPDGMVDASLVRDLELAEAALVRDVYTAAAEAGVRRLRLATREVAGAVAVRLLPLDFALFERVLGLGVTMPVTDADLDTIVAFYDEVGISESMVQLAPVAGAPAIEAGLRARGYEPGRRWLKLWRPLDEPIDAPPHAEASPIEVVDAATSAVYGSICEIAFETSPLTSPLASVVIGRPGWRHYLGRDAAGRPVACGAMRIEAGVAWLGNGATLPEARGRGWQGAMLRHRLAVARAAGSRIATIEMAEMDAEVEEPVSLRNARRVGFRVGYRRQDWVRRIPH